MRDRLEMLQRLAGYATLADFARACGINDATMRQHIARERVPYAKAQQYARTVARRGVAVTADWIMNGRGPAPFVNSRYADSPSTGDIAAANIPSGGSDASDPQAVHHPRGEIRFFESSELPGGLMNVAWARPGRLPGRPDWSNSENDFALYVHTDIMDPAIERGDRILMNTVTPPVVGDLVVLMQDIAEQGRIVAIRRLVSITDAAWRCRQLNPDKAENFDRSRWRAIYRIQEIRKK